MKVSVWDTYVSREDGKQMHFDILVPSDLKDENTIFNFGKSYLKSKPFATKGLTSKECRFCHVEQASESIEEAIRSKGYYIIEMENCN
ncbi:DUF2024 family protein [Winogradskyella pulchriflava]|uniref:DUF2024 family protein n=1 Tax=Winogradskyella pulchriflava TaxID=1110688 RepID=A0ABV6Q435_9FLAO